MPKTIIMYKNITKVLCAFIFIASMGKEHAASGKEEDISYTYTLNSINGREYAYTPILVSDEDKIFKIIEAESNRSKCVYEFSLDILRNSAKEDILKKWWISSCFFNIIHTRRVKYTLQYGNPNKIMKDPNNQETRTTYPLRSSSTFQIEVNLGQGDQLKKVTVVLEKKFKKRFIFYIGMVLVGIKFLWDYRKELRQYLNAKCKH